MPPASFVLKHTGIALGCVLLAACQAIPQHRSRSSPASQAVTPRENPEFTKAGVSAPRPSGEGRAHLSGVAQMHEGFEAFAARVALARFARQSLDIQYYIWDGDQTGTYLLAELLAAADRGVRVRLLLDDITSGGLVDGLLQQLTAGVRAAGAEFEEGLSTFTPDELERHNRVRELMDEIHSGGRDLVGAALDTHPNIEVRLFNPLSTRSGGLRRALHLVWNFSQQNRRMHNKVFAADNQLAIVGGRNIADNYFGLHEKYDFRDLDLLVRGPVVRDIEANFDLYWNSDWAVPVHAFSWKRRSEQRLESLREELAGVFREARDERLTRLDRKEETTRVLGAVVQRMVTGPVAVVADVPGKVNPSGDPLVAEALAAHADDSHREILVESAYFVPVNLTFQRMQERIADGVRVSILTNSMASTNQMLAHAGYSKHRRKLLRTGVTLHELKPHPDSHHAPGTPRGPRTVLHTKAVVFDRERVFVGTFNLDPRSADLNTEVGLLVQHPGLAKETARFIETGMTPDRSWRLQLGRPGTRAEGRASGSLCWICGEAHSPEVVHREPETPWRSRLLMRLASWLPIDGML